MRVVLLSLILGGQALAGRPFVTDDFGTVAVHAFQIETGFELQGDAASPALAIKHGITPFFDLGLSLSSSTLPWKSDCVNGHNLLLKFALWPEHLVLSSALDLQSGTAVWNGIVSQPFWGLESHVNVAVEMDSSTTELDYALLLRKAWQTLAVGTEVYGCSDSKPSWQLGVQWMPFDVLNLDAGLVYGMDQNSWQSNVGLSLSFGGI